MNSTKEREILESEGRMLIFVKKNLQNESFSEKEIFSLLDMLGVKYKVVEKQKRYMLIESLNITSEEINTLKERVAYNKEIGIVIAFKEKLKYTPPYPIRINSHKGMLQKFSKFGIPLDINSPYEARVCDSVLYEVIKEVKEKEFMERHGKNKPGFMPFSLHPRLSKALYNIAQVKKGDLVLDAFCGVGGIVIEGEIIGVKTVCLEKYGKICRKAYINFNYYLNKPCFLIKGDAMTLPFKDNIFDAIISDMPYGRSTKVESNKESLYTSFLKEGARVLKENGKMIILSDKSSINIPPELKITYTTSFYVHRSLSRYLYVVEYSTF